MNLGGLKLREERILPDTHKHIYTLFLSSRGERGEREKERHEEKFLWKVDHQPSDGLYMCVYWVQHEDAGFIDKIRLQMRIHRRFQSEFNLRWARLAKKWKLKQQTSHATSSPIFLTFDWKPTDYPRPSRVVNGKRTRDENNPSGFF